MSMIESHRTIGIPIPANQNDEKFGEDIVESFIARANAMRRAQGLSDLCVGALTSTGLSGTIRVEVLLPS
jgi:hypothetical protein